MGAGACASLGRGAPTLFSARCSFLRQGRDQGAPPTPACGSQLRTDHRSSPWGPGGQDPSWGPAALCHSSHVRAELYYGASGFFFFYCRIDPYGFERPEDFDYAAYEEFFSTYLVILTRRAIKWSKLLKGSSSVQKSMTGEFGAWSITPAANRSLAVKCSWAQRGSGFLRPLTLGGCLESGVCILSCCSGNQEVTRQVGMCPMQA